jgi:uncharacterized protein YwqG
MDDLAQRLYQEGLSQYEPQLRKLVLPSVKLNLALANETEVKIGASKLGGFPDLLPDIKWPHWKEIPLSFLAQICLEDIRPYDVKQILPSHGLLSFFLLDVQYTLDLDSYPFWAYASVQYFDRDLISLRRVVPPSTLPPDDIYPTCTLNFMSNATLPPPGVWLTEKLALPAEVHTIYDDKVWIGLETAKEPYHHLLGYAESIYKESMDYDEEALLLQIDSDANIGLSWGDRGILYFTIKQVDLQNGDFSKVQVSYEGL